MSYAGHVLGMIQRIRTNRELIGKRDRLFSGMNDRIVKSYRHSTRNVKQITAEQKLELRQKLIHEHRREFVKKVLALSLAIFILGIIAWLIQNYLRLEHFMIYGK